MRWNQEIHFPGSLRRATALAAVLFVGGDLSVYYLAIRVGLPENPDPALVYRDQAFLGGYGVEAMLAPGPVMFVFGLLCRNHRLVSALFALLAAFEIGAAFYQT
jgi:hypothetical protein